MQKVSDHTRKAERPRGRPREFDRALALAAATEVFWRRGYTATSMADLTAAMGIGATSLYAAFGSKEQLFAAAIGYYAETHGPKIWSRFREAPTARDAIAALLLDSAAALGSEDGDRPRGCMVALSAVGEEGCAELGRLVAGHRAEGLEMVRDRLRRAVSEGEIPATADADAIARFYVAVQGGLSLQARDGAGRAELDAVARAALACWDALVGAPPSETGDRALEPKRHSAHSRSDE